MIEAIIAIGAAVAEIVALLYELVKVTAALAVILGLIEIVFDPKGAQKIGVLVGNIVRGALGVAGPILKEVQKDLAPIVTQFSAAMKEAGAPILEDLKKPLENFASAAFDAVKVNLEKKRNIQPADWEELAGKAMSDAAAFGLGSFVVSAAFEAAFPEKLNTLNSLGPMLATLAGFNEVTRAALRPLYSAAIGVPATYDANSKFRSHQPALGMAMQMYARRRIDLGTFMKLVGYAGLPPEFERPILEIAYRPVSPRALATMMADVPFDEPAMRRLLEDNSLSPETEDFLTHAMEYNSTKNVRNAYVGEAIAAHAAGVIDETELDAVIDEVGWGPAAKSLVRKRALMQRRIALVRQIDLETVPLVSNGLLSAEQGEQRLEAAGAQPWFARLRVELGVDRALIQATRRELATERRSELARERELTRAAIVEFQAGRLDLAALEVALLAIPLAPLLVASIVVVQEALAHGKLRLAFGRHLSPDDARILTERVAAIGEQTIKKLLTPEQALAELGGLGVEAEQAQALAAKWAAQGAHRLLTP